jgi:hypothetical protein
MVMMAQTDSSCAVVCDTRALYLKAADDSGRQRRIDVGAHKHRVGQYKAAWL